MLLTRLLTSLILIPLVVAGVWWLSTPVFATVTAFFFMLGVWEWADLTGLTKPGYKLLYTLTWLALIFITYHAVSPPSELARWLLLAAVLIWLMTFVSMIVYPRGLQRWMKVQTSKGVLGQLLFLFCWVALTELKTIDGPMYIVYVLILIWLVDSASYFTGKFWGKHALVPQLSPKKTVEGLIGGMTVALLFVLVTKWAANLSWYSWSSLLLISLFTMAFAIGGDLFESMLKRQTGIKDSGRLIPGHGGVLDRIDSLVAALPVFALGLQLWI